MASCVTRACRRTPPRRRTRSTSRQGGGGAYNLAHRFRAPLPSPFVPRLIASASGGAPKPHVGVVSMPIVCLRAAQGWVRRVARELRHGGGLGGCVYQGPTVKKYAPPSPQTRTLQVAHRLERARAHAPPPAPHSRCGTPSSALPTPHLKYVGIVGPSSQQFTIIPFPDQDTSEHDALSASHTWWWRAWGGEAGARESIDRSIDRVETKRLGR